MRRPKWLTPAMVTAIHDEAIYEFGGLAGIRDRGILQSVVDRARNRLAHEPKATLFELAASLGVGFARNHGFPDGNKRTALLATRAFLFLNRYALEPAQENEVVTIIGVADGSIDEPSFARWLEVNSKKVKR